MWLGMDTSSFVRPLVLFLLAIVLSVLLRFTVSGYPFGIFKLFYLFLAIMNKYNSYDKFCSLYTRFTVRVIFIS